MWLDFERGILDQGSRDTKDLLECQRQGVGDFKSVFKSAEKEFTLDVD